jgi:hypothetical protein
MSCSPPPTPQAIYDYFDQTQPGLYKHFDDMFPVVTCEANFDEILIPADHVSRSANDTYYVSSQQVLRCHTSAHQAELLRTKQPAFLVTGGLVVGWWWEGRPGEWGSGNVMRLGWMPGCLLWQ